MADGHPWFVLVGGVNGAGKSTFAQDPKTLSAIEEGLGDVQVINPTSSPKTF